MSTGPTDPSASAACSHEAPASTGLRWDLPGQSVIFNCGECGAEGIAAVEWDDVDWGDD